MIECDALVVGGGPAGSTTAAFLARRGRSVLLLERDHHPRFHIGESLLPIDLPIFERLGVVLDYKDFIRKDGAEFIDERTGATATFVFREGLEGTPKYAYQVERSRFDHHLLKQAEATIDGFREERKMTSDIRAAREMVAQGDEDDEHVANAA